MPHAPDGAHFVMLCDWRGRCIWASAANYSVKVGEFIWEHLATESQEDTKVLLGQVVTLREPQRLEVIDQQGHRFRGRLWPLDSPDVAVCMLAVRIPRELALLTQRERECLELLAKGIETRAIANQLDVSASTIHTHLKRTRDKLGLLSSEALISFAARYCYPPDEPLSTRPPCLG
jgi:DNA-binding CsgD family transcriptional regulator